MKKKFKVPKKRKGAKKLYLKGSESWPSRGLLFGLLARGHPDKLLWDE